LAHSYNELLSSVLDSSAILRSDLGSLASFASNLFLGKLNQKLLKSLKQLLNLLAMKFHIQSFLFPGDMDDYTTPSMCQKGRFAKIR